jgi:hypothetical protein
MARRGIGTLVVFAAIGLLYVVVLTRGTLSLW